MTVLRKRNNQDVKKCVTFLGMYVPEEVAHFLSLFCLSEGVTKTSILKSELLKWTEEQQKINPQEILIRKIANRILDNWRNPVKSRTNFSLFRNNLIIEFKNRGIDPNISNEIINIVINEKDRK